MRFAWQGVTANKMRSALTTLGVLIGVAAVIILVAVGTGSSRAVQESISSLGTNTLTITATQGGAGGRGGRARGRPAWRRRVPRGRRWAAAPRPVDTAYLDPGRRAHAWTDAEAIATSDDAPDVVGVAPVVSATSVTATL